MGDDRGGVLNFEALNGILSCVQEANTYLNSKVGPESELWSRLRVGEREDAEHFRGKWYGRSLGVTKTSFSGSVHPWMNVIRLYFVSGASLC